MTYEWKVVGASLRSARSDYDSPRLEDVLKSLQAKGYEIFAIVCDSGNGPHVIARKAVL